MLNPKQEAFCLEYVKDHNATQAAIRAGYAKSRANETGARLVANGSIKARLKELEGVARKRHTVEAETIIDELAAIVRADPLDYLEDDGQALRLARDLKKRDTRALRSIKITTRPGKEGDAPSQVVEFQLWDKTRAAELLGRHFGIFERDNAQRTPGNNENRLLTEYLAVPENKERLRDKLGKLIREDAGDNGNC